MTAIALAIPPTSTLCDLLWLRPDYRGGRLCIAGTGISVARIGILHTQGLSVEEIWDDLFQSVSLAHIHAALAYYLANQEAVEADITARDEDGARMEREYKAQRAADR